MKSGRRVAFTVETHEVTVFRRRQPPIHAWCAACRRDVELVEPDEAARWAGDTSRTIYRWIEAGKVHFMETPKGALYVCRNSLPVQASPPAKAPPKLPA